MAVKIAFLSCLVGFCAAQASWDFTAFTSTDCSGDAILTLLNQPDPAGGTATPCASLSATANSVFFDSDGPSLLGWDDTAVNCDANLGGEPDEKALIAITSGDTEGYCRVLADGDFAQTITQWQVSAYET